MSSGHRATRSVPVVERRQVALGSGLWPGDFIILEADGDQVLAAHYRLRTPNEHPGGPGTPDEETFARLVEGGYVPERSKRDAWVRTAARGPSLLAALRPALERSRHDPDTVAAYLRSTSWGQGL
jgi:hypothetical protein